MASSRDPLSVPSPDADGLLPASGAEERDGGRGLAGELEASLARHLMGGRDTADLGQSLLAVVTVFIFWPVVPWWMALAWLALFLVSSAVRTAHRRQVVPALHDDGPALLALLRRDVWLSTLLWGGWALLMVGAAPKDLAFLLIIVAGLVAAGTSTLVADPTAFRGFMAFLLGPLFLAVVLSGWSRDHLNLLLLMGLYAPFMLVVYRRAHALLVDQIDTSVRLRASQAETARRRDFLNALVSSAPSAVLVTDADGRVVRANPALEEVLGFTPDEVVGRELGDLVVGSVDGDAFHDFLASVQEGERVVDEVRLRHRDGHRVWMRVSGTAAGGAAAGSLIFVGEDVTDQVEAREAQERARAEAEQVARAKSAFLASMSHEIRTPLNGILGMVELLLDSELTDEQRDSAEVVRSSGEGLLRILNDILDVSKIEAGQLDLERIDFAVSDVVGDAIRVFTGSAAAKGLELMLDMRPEVPARAHGDPIRIRQILTNLLANAVKFTAEGEVVVRVEVVAERDGVVDLRFAVRDTGVGIPRETQARIFDEFEQADSSTTRTHGGTGLGLTICKRLVELMGGEIGVESTPGEGSEFWFVLPLREAETTRDDLPPRTRVDLRGRRFLVVDDNRTARRIVREALVRAGALEVVERAGVDEGLDAFRGNGDDDPGFDAVILDHMMPGRDGFDFALAVRDDPEAGGAPILMLTSGGAAARREAEEAGISGFLSKPVSRSTLLEALEEVLEEAPGEGRALVTEATLAHGHRETRILVAEDNVVNMQVAVALLERRGYEVVPVPDGAQAVEAVKNGTFDLVLMDIQMPVMDGLEATRAIRALEGFGDLPIVALTAHAFAEERDRTRRAGMDDFLAKPFRPEELYEMVDRWTGAERGRADPASGPREGRGGPPAGRDRPPVDLDAFRAVMREAGVEEIVGTTVRVYLEEAPELFRSLEAALAEERLDGVRKAAHSLKSSSGNIRATGLAGLLQKVEDRARAGDGDGVAELVPRVRKEFSAVMAQLRAGEG